MINYLDKIKDLTVVPVETQPGKNASFDQIKEAFDNNPDVKAFYCVWNETSTGTMIHAMMHTRYGHV